MVYQDGEPKSSLTFVFIHEAIEGLLTKRLAMLEFFDAVLQFGHGQEVRRVLIFKHS
jgi:hypothetical protein